jgi:hypothetical protein
MMNNLNQKENIKNLKNLKNLSHHKLLILIFKIKLNILRVNKVIQILINKIFLKTWMKREI